MTNEKKVIYYDGDGRKSAKKPFRQERGLRLLSKLRERRMENES